MIILGVDPGTNQTGYAFLKIHTKGIAALDFGVIKPPRELEYTQKYLVISKGIRHLLKAIVPDEVVFETQFSSSKNPLSPIKLGMARCAAMLPCLELELPIFEYAPKEIKKAVTGNGNASKYQIQKMTQQMLGLKTPPEPEDAADAIAIAICRHHRTKRGLYV